MLLLGTIMLALVGLVAAMQRPVAMGVSSASVMFDHASTDWNAGERTKDGTAFRWTGRESALNFRAARRILPVNKQLTLTMRFAARPAGAPVTTVTLLANGQMLDTWSSNVEHPVAVAVGALLRRHDELHVTVRTDNAFSPAGDPRQLGIQLVGDARLAPAPGPQLPSPDAAMSVIALALLALLAAGRRASLRQRLITAGAMGCAIILGVLVARVPFWRIAMPLELLLALVVIVLWAREWWAALMAPIRALQARLGLDDRALIVVGAIMAVAGQAVVAQQRWMIPGAALLILGLVVLLAGIVPNPPTAQRAPAFPTGEGGEVGAHSCAPSVGNAPANRGDCGLGVLPREETRLVRWQVVGLLGIIAVAVVLRVTLLTEMPASLFRDEARHALRAARIVDDPGYRPVFEPEIYLPALFLYPLALAFKLFGVSIMTLRLLMALIGVGDVLLLFLLGRQLFGTRVGLIAAALFAASFWALRAERIGFAQSFACGLVLLALFLFVRAVQTGRWRDWTLAGVGAAGTIYSYFTGPFALILMALVALAFLVRAPRRFPRFWLPRFALLAVVFLVLAVPLLRYIALHFDQYALRPRQTAILSETNLRRLGQDQLTAVQANIPPTLGMYTVRGDFEPKHNLPHAPHLDAITAVLFLTGLALLFARRRFGEWFVLGYFVLMFIPSVLAIDAPNTFRAFDTLPPALLIAALAADAIWIRLGMVAAPSPDPSPVRGRRELDGDRAANSPLPPQWGRARERGEPALVALAALTFVAILALNAGTYFGIMRNNPTETFRFDTYFATQAGKRIVAESTAHPGMAFYVPQAAIDRDVFPFFARVIGDRGTLRPLDGVNPANLPARYAILLPNGTQDTPPDAVVAALPWAKGLERVSGNSPAGAGGIPAFVEYRTPA
jgi:hypothetical protein